MIVEVATIVSFFLILAFILFAFIYCCLGGDAIPKAKEAQRAKRKRKLEKLKLQVPTQPVSRAEMVPLLLSKNELK